MLNSFNFLFQRCLPGDGLHYTYTFDKGNGINDKLALRLAEFLTIKDTLKKT